MVLFFKENKLIKVNYKIFYQDHKIKYTIFFAYYIRLTGLIKCVLISKLYFQLNSSYGAFDARLNGITGNNNPGSWSPRLLDLGQWIQVDLGKIAAITKIATQGGGEAAQWVTEYKVSYSLDGGYFKFYQLLQVSNNSLAKVSFVRKG